MEFVTVRQKDEKTIGVVGIRDLIVVATRHAVLVCPKSEAQRVKQVVANLALKK